MVNSPETINPIFDQDPGRLEVTAVREGSLKERASRYVHGSGDGDEARHHLASSPTSFHHTDQLSNGHLSPRPGKEGQAIVNGHSSTSSNEADGQLGQVERPALDRLPRSSQTAGYAAPNSRLAPANGDEGVRQVAAEAPIPLYDSGESLRLAPSPASLSTSLPASTPSSSSPNGYLQPPSPAKRAVPPGSMRRSLTSGASPSPSTSRSPNRGRVVQRTMSQGPLAISPVEATSDELAVSPVSDDSEAAFRDSLARQADEIRRERAERRKQVAEPQRAPSTSRIVAKGNPISDGHQSWLLMYNMLTGIRVAVSRCEAKAKRPLTKADYRATTKFSFDTLGNELTPSVKHDFKFKVRYVCPGLQPTAEEAGRTTRRGSFEIYASTSASIPPTISSPSPPNTFSPSLDRPASLAPSSTTAPTFATSSRPSRATSIASFAASSNLITLTSRRTLIPSSLASTACIASRCQRARRLPFSS